MFNKKIPTKNVKKDVGVIHYPPASEASRGVY